MGVKLLKLKGLVFITAFLVFQFSFARICSGQQLIVQDTILQDSLVFEPGDRVYYKLINSNFPRAGILDSFNSVFLYVEGRTVAIGSLYYIVKGTFTTVFYNSLLGLLNATSISGIIGSPFYSVVLVVIFNDDYLLYSAPYLSFLSFAVWHLIRVLHIGYNARAGLRLARCSVTYFP